MLERLVICSVEMFTFVTSLQPLFIFIDSFQISSTVSQSWCQDTKAFTMEPTGGLRIGPKLESMRVQRSTLPFFRTRTKSSYPPPPQKKSELQAFIGS